MPWLDLNVQCSQNTRIQGPLYYGSSKWSLLLSVLCPFTMATYRGQRKGSFTIESGIIQPLLNRVRQCGASTLTKNQKVLCYKVLDYSGMQHSEFIGISRQKNIYRHKYRRCLWNRRVRQPLDYLQWNENLKLEVRHPEYWDFQILGIAPRLAFDFWIYFFFLVLAPYLGALKSNLSSHCQTLNHIFTWTNALAVCSHYKIDLVRMNGHTV